MVNGVAMHFSKERMLNRIKEEGRMNLVGPAELAIMDNLDGQPVSTANWNRQVRGDAVLSCQGKDGKVYDVAEVDCLPG